MFYPKFILMAFILSSISACGKKGDPYVSEPSSFPRPYPHDAYEEAGTRLDEEPVRESL